MYARLPGVVSVSVQLVAKRAATTHRITPVMLGDPSRGHAFFERSAELIRAALEGSEPADVFANGVAAWPVLEAAAQGAPIRRLALTFPILPPPATLPRQREGARLADLTADVLVVTSTARRDYRRTARYLTEHIARITVEEPGGVLAAWLPRTPVIVSDLVTAFLEDRR